MKAYTFDPAGHYVATIKVDQDPLAPGRFLMPPNSTTVAPPAASESRVPRWTGTAWELVYNPSSHKRG